MKKILFLGFLSAFVYAGPEDTSQALQDLRRFQTLGTFRVGTDDFKTLDEIFHDESFVNKYPNLTINALYVVLVKSKDSYLELLKHNPHLLEVADGKRSIPLLEDTRSLKKIKKAAAKLMNQLIKKNGRYSVSKDWDALRALQPLYLKLPMDEVWIMADPVIQSIVNDASRETNIFASKLYFLVESSIIDRIFGRRHAYGSEVIIKRTEKTAVPIVLSGPDIIDGDESTRTPWGFSMKAYEPIAVPDVKDPQVILDREFHWMLGSKPKAAKVHVIAYPESGREILPAGKSFDYQAAWGANKTLTGVVIPGSNLENEEKAFVQEYFDYFKQKGFQHSVMDVEDVPSFLKEGVASGEFDILVKEAHSGADELNVFRFDKKLKMHKFTKHHEDGRREVFWVGEPNPKQKEPSHLLSGKDFGEWMKVRSSMTDPSPMIFLNASCWSCEKALQEISSARTPLLVEIPSKTGTNFFRNHPSAVVYQILQGIRKGLPWKEIRKNINRLCREEGSPIETLDQYLLPDEKAYIDQMAPRIGETATTYSVKKIPINGNGPCEAHPIDGLTRQ